MRNDALIRVLSIIERLRVGRRSIDELALEFHVTPRTIRRDLAAMSAAGLPLRQNNAANQGPGVLWWIA
jgi:predicted DNA-binding transcriptional regulator YafY